MKEVLLLVAGIGLLATAVFGAFLAIFVDRDRHKSFWHVVLFWFVESVYVAIGCACIYFAK